MRFRAAVASTTILAFAMTLLGPRRAQAEPKGGDRSTAAPGGGGATGTSPSGAPSTAPTAAAAETPTVSDSATSIAKQHFETGKNAYNAGDYSTAIREFKAAEALRPSPVLAYNIGLANERLGKLRVAIKYYRRYLEGQPNASNKDEVQAKIAALEQQMAGQPVPGAAAPVEQPGDMPPPSGMPPSAGALAPAPNPPPAPGYDPYNGSSPPPAAPPPLPHKKKSYWWVWLIVAGGATIITFSVLAYAASSPTVYEKAPNRDGALLRF